MAREFACRLSLLAFATAALRGAGSGVELDGALRTSLTAAAAFFALGLFLGELGRRLAEEAAAADFAKFKSQSTQQLGQGNAPEQA